MTTANLVLSIKAKFGGSKHLETPEEFHEHARWGQQSACQHGKLSLPGQ